MTPPDVLYRVKGNRSNEQLRYSLRSLCNVEHGEVWLVGLMPPWVRGVQYIPGDHYSSKWAGLVGDLYVACKDLTGRKLLLMDDDFFVLEAKPIPAVHLGPLKDHAQRLSGSYARSLAATYQYLVNMGVKEPLSYEAHVPMLIEADAMAEILRPVLKARMPLQARSLYGNLRKVKAKRMDDVKVRRGEPLPTGPLLSGNGMLNLVLPVLAAAFPEGCRYERAA